jgi:hypothetical protein
MQRTQKGKSESAENMTKKTYMYGEHIGFTVKEEHISLGKGEEGGVNFQPVI